MEYVAKLKDIVIDAENEEQAYQFLVDELIDAIREKRLEVEIKEK